MSRGRYDQWLKMQAEVFTKHQIIMSIVAPDHCEQMRELRDNF
eukprot:COSAG01_NODE_26649_length_707_cov_1.009868_1_plen_42_part_10